jgi:hypothetical protein
MSPPIKLLFRNFASAAGGDKTRVFFGLNRQYSLRDRRIKAGPPQPRKVPFHRTGVAPPGSKYFCKDFQNPTTDLSNASFTIEYRAFRDIDNMEKVKQTLHRLLPGCNVTPMAVENDNFKVTRSVDKRVIFEQPTEFELNIGHLRQLVDTARRY